MLNYFSEAGLRMRQGSLESDSNSSTLRGQSGFKRRMSSFNRRLSVSAERKKPWSAGAFQAKSQRAILKSRSAT